MKILIEHLEKSRCMIVDLVEVFDLTICDDKVVVILRDGRKVSLFDKMCNIPKEQTAEQMYQHILLALKHQHLNTVLELKSCDSWKDILFNHYRLALK
jgi:ABC-type sugar transport system ATPase subunit